MTAFFTELQKARRRHDLALCLLIPGIVVLWVGGLAPAAPDELANGYSALLYSLPVIEAILMPVMMAVLASRLWDMEIKGNTPKLLYTLQSRRSLFAGKAVVVPGAAMKAMTLARHFAPDSILARITYHFQHKKGAK